MSVLPGTPISVGRRRRATVPSLGRAAVGLVALLLVVVGLLPAGAQRAAAEDAPSLTYALTDDIDTLNPFLAILASSTGILRFQYENLVQYGTNNEAVPGLAEKWETSADKKTWTFTLHPDLKWSDDQPLTAEDVAWTFQAVKDTPALQQANGGLVTNVASVTAKDPQTVEIVLTTPQASNPGMELPIVPKHVWEKVDAATYANDTDTVGSGPFVIKSYAKGQSVQLVANPNFWRGPAKIAGITYVSYKSGDAAVQALRTGEVDVVSGLTPAQFKALQGQAGIEVNSGADRRYTSLAINPGALDADGKPLGDGNPALQDQKLREAIFTAIDNKTLLEKVRQGLGKQGETEIPTVYPDYFGFAPGTSARPFDPAAANTMLDEAGYEKGSDGIRLDKQGKPLKLRLMGRNTDPLHQQMADYIKPWLADIGIDVTVSMVTPNQVNDDSTLGKYDLYFTGWGIGPDPDFQLSINRCDSRPNADGSGATSENNWCSPEFDKLYDAQHAELDQQKRSELVRQAFTVLHEAAVNDVIWYADKLEAYRSDKFTNLTKQPEDGGVITGQNGYWAFYDAAPAGAAQGGGDAAGSGGFPGWAIGVGAAVVVIIVAGIVIMTVRRRAGAQDRE